MIFEDRPDYRRQLLAMMADDATLEVAGDASTTWDVVRRVKRARPDVILMDLEMPTSSRKLDDRAGTKAILALRDALGEAAPAVVVLTNFTDDDRIFEAFCAGGSISYLSKPVTLTTLRRAVHRAAAGEPFSSPYIAGRIRELLGNPVNRRNAALLSKRETEALTYLKQGYSQQETADLMGIVTVKDLLKSIYRKLEVNGLRQAENKVWYNHLNILRWLRKE